MIEQPADSAPPTLREGELDREVPRREGGDRPDRLAQHGVAHAGLGGNDAAVGAAALLRVPLDDVGGALHFQARLRDRLALLERHDHRHLLDALAHDADRLQDDLGALGGRRVAPDLEALLGRGDGGGKVGRGGMRHRADARLVGRVDDGLAGAGDPLAVDQQLQFGIVGHVMRPQLPVASRQAISRLMPSRMSTCGRQPMVLSASV